MNTVERLRRGLEILGPLGARRAVANHDNLVVGVDVAPSLDQINELRRLGWTPGPADSWSIELD